MATLVLAVACLLAGAHAQSLRTANGTIYLEVNGATLTLGSNNAPTGAVGASAVVTNADLAAAIAQLASQTQAQINNAVLLLNSTNGRVDGQATATAAEMARAMLAEGTLTATVVAVEASVGGVATSLGQTQSTLAQTQGALTQTQSTLIQTQSALLLTQTSLAQTQSALVQAQGSLSTILAQGVMNTTALARQLAAITNCTARGMLPDQSGNCIAITASSSSSSTTTGSAQCPASNISSTSITAVCQPGFSPVSSSTPACAAGGSFPVTFTCAAVDCPSNSNGINIPSGCACNAGYSGTIIPTTTAPYFSGKCLPVSCPPVVSVGTNVPAGCVCGPGYNGTVTATTTSPFYASTCTAISCPAFSSGASVPAGCACLAGYSGAPTPTSTAPFYASPCVAVSCPANSAGSNIPAGCSCNAGYSGAITASTVSPYYTGACSAVACTAFSTGTSVPAGCTCSSTQGLYGPTLTPTTTAPYYSSACATYASCKLLAATSYGTTSGVYYLTYDSGLRLPAYCDQTTNGGGWELVLKTANSGTTFTYTAAAWTATSPINSASLDESNADALFPQYYSANYSHVMVKFKVSTYNWFWPTTSIDPRAGTTVYKTVLSFFTMSGYSFLPTYGVGTNTANAYNSIPYWTASSTGNFASGNVFSYEIGCSTCGGGYHDFAINSCCGSTCVRWGWIQNNENDCQSNDVGGGLGLTFNSLGAGDFYGCCGNSGINTGMQALVYARKA
eukprot:m.139504 g.139504  ORF g.139504 m.139504 type:complete len:734 (+) comp9616_c0_seq11:19-2220(+)